MNENRKSYSTRQKDLILNCLRENRQRHLTAEMIVDDLKDRGEPVGQTTVYRNLEKMVKDGMLLKFAAPGGMHACYQYLESPEDHLNHHHLVCVGCGQLIHLSCGHIDELTAHIQEEHGFHLDSFKTIFYGCCESCAAKGEARCT